MVRFVLALLFSLALMHSQVGATGRELTIVTLEYTPYVSGSLPNNGWAWEVAEKALESQGYSPRLKILPWARAKKLTQLGKADALYLANDNPTRREWAVFSNPVGEEVSVAFKLKARNITFKHPTELKRYRLVGLRGAHVTEKLKSLGLTFVEVTEVADGLKLIYHDRADLFVSDRYVASHIMKTQFPAAYAVTIDFIDNPLDINYFHLAISRKVADHAQIRDAFNRGLAQIRQSGLFRAILEKHGF